MAKFKCTLTPTAVGRLHTALSCLAKFNEILGLEIRDEKLSLIAFNVSKTTCASVTLARDRFFQRYSFTADDAEGRFRCELYNKSLASVFKGRVGDARDAESGLERCEIELQDDLENVECRLVIQMIVRSGVRRTHKLSYEDTDVKRAAFNKDRAGNHWTMSAYMLKSFSEYFGAKTELLDIYSEEGRATFTSYTEKVMKGSEVLRQPLQTSIDIDTLDFSDYHVEDQLHIGISVRDFRSIVTHAETMRTAINAYFSRPGQPLLMAYAEHGLSCEFILSTTGQFRGSTTVTPAVSRPATATPSAPPSLRGSVAPSIPPAGVQVPVSGPASRQASEMPPPAKMQKRNPPPPSESRASSFRPLPAAPTASVDEQSLFVTDEDDERQWGEGNYDDEEDQLGWNDSYTTEPLKSLTQASFAKSRVGESFSVAEEVEVPPTQSMTGMRGLFD